MSASFILWLFSLTGKAVVGAGATWLLSRLLDRPIDEIQEAVDQAREEARAAFHSRHGDAFGAPGSTFIDRKRNAHLLLRSTLPGEERLTAEALDPRGFDGAPDVTREARAHFLEDFYEALDHTDVRELKRDRALQEATRERDDIQRGVDTTVDAVRHLRSDVQGFDEKLDALLREQVLPAPVRAALAQPQLDELSELMASGQADEAYAYAVDHIEAIDAALEGVDDPERRYAEALRSHRQRLMFTAASSASWRGDVEAGRGWWRRARALGPIDAPWRAQAAQAAFNVGLAGELRHLMSQMEPTGAAYEEHLPLLAYLEQNWQTVDELLAEAEGADLLLMRAHARLQVLDAQDVAAVEVTEQLLTQAEEQEMLVPRRLLCARLTLDLLEQVLRGYTPLDYDRRSLVESVIPRVTAALEATRPDSLLRARALMHLGHAARLLRDDALGAAFNEGVDALDDDLQSKAFFRFDTPPAPEAIDDMLEASTIEPYQAVVLRATHYQRVGAPEEVERVLREALYAVPDRRERAQVLRLLTRHLRSTNRTEEARQLIEQTPLRPADRWLLRAENVPPGRHPVDIADEVEAFPLDVEVLRRLARSSLAAVGSALSDAPAPDPAALERAEEAVQWTTRLAEALPSRSSRHLHAEALLAAQRYDDLLTAAQALDPVYAERAAELEAWALDGLGRRGEAADRLFAAATEHPHSVRLAINASALLLRDGRPGDAADLLEVRVDAETTEPGILVNYARALLAQDPASRAQASLAFDLLSQAYHIEPGPEIAGAAWQAARAAGREQEAGSFFQAMVEGAAQVTVRTAEDIDAAIEAHGHRFIQFGGALDALADRMRRDRERTQALNTMASLHMLAYVDLFRFTGRPWEHWARWVLRFERRRNKEFLSPGAFSVLIDWPSALLEHVRRHQTEDLRLLADPTALMTLGLLGPEAAQEIIEALGTLHVLPRTLEGLQEERGRIEANVLVGGARPYVETIQFLETTGTIVPYSDEVEAAAPDEPALGPSRVDLGVAVHYGGRYVTDLDRTQEGSAEVRRHTISSAAVLASLNAAGAVTGDQARDAAERHPSTFGGWEAATPARLPETLVFDEFAVLDWVDAGLAPALEGRLTVGPWAWTQLREGAERQEAGRSAHEHLTGLIDVLRAAIDVGTVVEVDAADGAALPVAREDAAETEGPHIETMWAHALRSLRTAEAHDLQLWADDRFYALLLWQGGPPVSDPQIDEVRASLRTDGDPTPPLSTMDVLNHLAQEGQLARAVAQDAARQLFEKGYRPAHPLVLDYVLRQYPAPDGGAPPPPYQALIDGVTDIQHFLPDDLDTARREGFSRVATAQVAERLLVRVWEAEGLQDGQRRYLADRFLAAVEQAFQELSPTPPAPRADRTAILFWRMVSSALQSMSAQNREEYERREAALNWLGDAASQREERHRDIVRLLEDNALASVEYTRGAAGADEEGDPSPQLTGAFAIWALVPLLGSELIDTLDPLLRRTMGLLADVDREGRLNIVIGAEVDGTEVTLTVTEEEMEEAAANVLARAMGGEERFARMIRALDVVFQYRRPAPEPWVEAGVAEGVQVPVDVRLSLFALLWADLPGLREVLVRLIIFNLAPIDPALAARVLEAKDDLLSEDDDTNRAARRELAIDVLQSGFFELQRDVSHAIWRFRRYDATALARFVGEIGEEAARSLVETDPAPPIQQIGSFLVPQAHFLGRRLLTDDFDDGAHVLEGVEQMLNGMSNEEGEDDALPDLPAWLGNRAVVAETAEDPFVAAWALRHVLLGLAVATEDPELGINGRTVTASDWATDYLHTALSADAEEPSVLRQRMAKRRRLASAVLLLAAFACSGEKHVTEIRGEEDPLLPWLDRVWLMATKLHVTLLGLKGGLSAAADAAVEAVQDLGLEGPQARAFDAFDPYALGTGEEDVGDALTLTAVLKALRQHPGPGLPAWWSGALQDRVRELAADRTVEEDMLEGRVGNRFGLVAPLQVAVLAARIMDHAQALSED